MTALRSGGILAAGEGSRLKRDGWAVHKPLARVGGVPLLEHVLSNFTAAGVNSVAIIFNEQEEDCARFARERFGKLDLRIVLRTTASSLESFRTIAPLVPPGPALFSTVDAWCPRSDFLAFVGAAARAGEDETVLAVTPFVDDERPLWVRADSAGRVTGVGGTSGDAVTAGTYVFSERARRIEPPPGLSRLREFLAWLVETGEPVRAISIPKVVDVDRGVDIATAQAMAYDESEVLSPKSEVFQPSTFNLQRATPAAKCWGIYRELAHSPGRETDDAEILRATAQRLTEKGFDVELKSADELPRTDDAAEIPPFFFVMCERPEVVERLSAWERNGARIVNRPEAIRNTDRERTIARFSGDGIAFPASVLVATGASTSRVSVPFPCWVKRGDVHATEAGDVAFARHADELASRLASLASRGITRAVVQEHVPGDLIKFYGVAGEDPEGEPLSWFQWFYHRDQTLANHRFDARQLRAVVAQAAAALGLDVFGGDAIATADGATILIDLNAWPSFALYRAEAANKIAAHLADCFRLSTLDSRLSTETQWQK